MMRAATAVLALAVLSTGCSLLGDRTATLRSPAGGLGRRATRPASVEVVTVTLELADASGTVTGTMRLAVGALSAKLRRAQLDRESNRWNRE